MPPDCAKVTPGRPLNRSITDAGYSRSISTRIIAVTDDSDSSTLIGVRMATTMTGLAVHEHNPPASRFIPWQDKPLGRLNTVDAPLGML